MNLISTAVVGKTYGVEGLLHVYSLSGETRHLMKLTSCILVLTDGTEKEVRVEKVLTHGSELLMRFFGYETPEKAKLLSKAVVKITREKAAPLKKGECYVADLIGMDLIFEGVALAKVEAVSEGAQSLMLHARVARDNKIRLVPYMEPFTLRADAEGMTIPLLMKELLEV
jgi:16S rRNA processing protein RimM